MNTFNIEALIAAVKPPETFAVEMPGGHVLVFRSIANADEEKEIIDETRNLEKVIASGNVHPAWKPYLIKDVRNLAYVTSLARLSVEPKLSVLDMLRLATEAPLYFGHLAREVDGYLRNAQAIEQSEGVEVAKKESPQTSLTGIG